MKWKGSAHVLLGEGRGKKLGANLNKKKRKILVAKFRRNFGWNFVIFVKNSLT